MKKKLTKVLAVVLALMMLVSASPMAFAATEIANGTAGEGVSWTLDSDGTLTISGNGPIVVDWLLRPYVPSGRNCRILLENSQFLLKAFRPESRL